MPPSSTSTPLIWSVASSSWPPRPSPSCATGPFWPSGGRAALERRLARARVAPVDDELASEVARVRVACRRIGHALADDHHANDLWIAATALRYRLPLVAHDGVFRQVPGLDLRTELAEPQIDWEDDKARCELIDSRATDGFAMVMALSGRKLCPAVHEAASLLLTVHGHDLEARGDGVFAIAHRVAPDRVISTVDVETRHGHKTSAHGFDGYKGHVAIDPDAELLTATAVSPGNAGDAAAATELLAELLEHYKAESGGGEAVGDGVVHGGSRKVAAGVGDNLRASHGPAPRLPPPRASRSVPGGRRSAVGAMDLRL